MKLKKVKISQAKEIQFTNNTPGEYLMEFEKAILKLSRGIMDKEKQLKK